MSHKLGICIPYRDREEHLNKLVSSLGPFLEKKGIEYTFYVAHQVDDKLFNRGSMKNIAALEAFKDGCDYVAWHDVDMLPHDDNCDYSYPETTPIHIATKLSKYSYSMGYEEYFLVLYCLIKNKLKGPTDILTDIGIGVKRMMIYYGDVNLRGM